MIDGYFCVQTYNVNAMVPDSAATAFAMVSGVKVNTVKIEVKVNTVKIEVKVNTVKIGVIR